jgi:hypothetical protein
LLVSFFVETVAGDVLERGALQSGQWDEPRLLEKGAIEGKCC